MSRIAQCFEALMQLPSPIDPDQMLPLKFERVQRKRFCTNFAQFIVDVRGLIHRK